MIFCPKANDMRMSSIHARGEEILLNGRISFLRHIPNLPDAL